MTDKYQTTKIPFIEWDSMWDGCGSRSLFREFIWLARNGSWSWCRNTRPLIFGAGRIWYDGPHWFAHLGWWSLSLECS